METVLNTSLMILSGTKTIKSTIETASWIWTGIQAIKKKISKKKKEFIAFDLPGEKWEMIASVES